MAEKNLVERICENVKTPILIGLASLTFIFGVGCKPPVAPTSNYVQIVINNNNNKSIYAPDNLILTSCSNPSQQSSMSFLVPVGSTLGVNIQIPANGKYDIEIDAVNKSGSSNVSDIWHNYPLTIGSIYNEQYNSTTEESTIDNTSCDVCNF